MITEKQYVKITDVLHRRKFAQYFTPEFISDFMARWVLCDLCSCAKILEPAYGLGVFSRSMFDLRDDIKVVGYDVDDRIFKYAKSNLLEINKDISLNNEDYLTSSWEKKYDGVICNPPYLKFHDYDNSTYISLINTRLNVNLNGFTNIYTLFLLKSIHQLKDGGRLAYIIPSEFLNSDYGVEVKRILLQSGVLRHVIIIDFNKSVFDDVLTTACILLCHKNGNSDVVKFSSIDNIEKLSNSISEYNAIETRLLDPKQKWKQFYENTNASNYNHLVPFSTFAKVSRGIATGANDYFTFNISKKDRYNIPDSCLRPCICHAVDIKSNVFTLNDFELLLRQDKTVMLFNGMSEENNINVRNYLCLGIEKGIDKKYLTSSRKVWYALENREPSPIWVSVFNRKGLRFVRNVADVYNLTTFHCVYNVGDINTDVLFAYLITDVAKEIFLDNSRQYGNGLVKFEPNDLNNGLVVDLRLLTVEETSFIHQTYKELQYYGSVSDKCIELLNDFFIAKYKYKSVDICNFVEQLDLIKEDARFSNPYSVKIKRIRQLNFLDLFYKFDYNPIVKNDVAHETDINDYNNIRFDKSVVNTSRNVLISLVKRDNEAVFLDRTATIYYTGKKFPTTVLLNKLYYFMPYIKGKGVRDLWIIKVVRLGCRKEGAVEENKDDLRLVFEIEFVKQIYDDYKHVELKIWRTFTDTNINELIEI